MLHIALTGFSAFSVLTATVIALCSYLLWRKQPISMGYPDGPFSLPIFGNLLHILVMGSMNDFINNCRKRYGNVFTIEFGGSKRVMVSGYNNIYRLLVTEADHTSDRSPASAARPAFLLKNPGIIWAPFPHWKVIRTLAIQSLREEGMGRSSLEPQLRHEIDLFCAQYLETHLDKPIELTIPLCKATNNIISEMIFGGRKDYDDAEYDFLIRMMCKGIALNARAAIMKNIPLIKYFKISGSKAVEKASKSVRGEMLRKVEEHKAKLDHTNPADIFDSFLCYQQSLPEEERSTVYSDENAASVATHLYAAGTETSSTALRWAFLYTCSHPEVLSKVQKEIKEKIGLNRPVSYSHRNVLLYTDAVLLETLRLANIASTGLPHTLNEAMEVEGQMVPAGTDLLFNWASVLHDETVFEDPLEFKPERYLSGDVKLKKQRTVPFSLGRRACLGESLARMELFMFYVTILQRYNVRLANKSSSLKPLVGAVSAPQPYDLIFMLAA